MNLLNSITDFGQIEGKHNRVIVPTMGALHAGHCSLIKLARIHAGQNGCVIVSIFVNPTQFDRAEDLDSYPSTLDSDLAFCEKYGADYVFLPKSEEMFPSNRSISLTETSLSKTLCGKTRPGHFDGVCLVVNKLLNITRATHAVFGEKDFQQLAIIQRMVRDLNINVEIISGETVREPSGLAMSSRNLLLTDENKVFAPAIFKALLQVRNLYRTGETSPQKLIATIANKLTCLPVKPKIDYLELVDSETLAPITAESTLEKKHAVIAIAIFFGEVRLIDHIHLD